MPHWVEDDLVTNGVRLHYRRAGAGARTLVFAHGLTDQGPCWLPVAEQLVGDYAIVLYDARGHGRSEAPEGGYTFDNLAGDMAGLIRGLGLDRPVVIGHSMGAATAGLAAARYPDLARAIVLEDPPTMANFNNTNRKAEAERWRAEKTEQKALSRPDLIAWGHARFPKWSEAELGPWSESKHLVSLNAIDIVADPGTSWYDSVEQIGCPILLITGDPALGAIVAPEAAAALEQRWQNGRVARIADAGHNIRRDNFEPYMAALRVFLSEVDWRE